MFRILILQLLCMIAFVSIGCSCPSIKEEAVVPLPTLTSVNIVSQNSSCHFVEAGGVEDYINRYGDEGWILVLSDKRSIEEAMPASSYKPIMSDNLSGVESPTIRVCDVVACHYLLKHSEELNLEFGIMWTNQKKDRLIAHVIRRIQRNIEP